MKVLLYTRPRLEGFYRALAQQWVGGANCFSMSDHAGLEPIWMMRYYYVALREKSSRFSHIPLDSQDYHSIILRCRYLKHLPFVSAIRRINAMWLAVERILDEVRPDVILGPVMDNYLLDVCDRVARTRNLEYSGLLENMINGYSRITTRGELRIHREPAESEVDAALQMLHQRTYVPRMQLDGMASTGSPTPATIFFKRYLRDRLKAVYFAAKRWSDPDNFHYNTVASAKVGLACGSVSHLNYAKYESVDWEVRIENAKMQGAKIIFFPLQFYPEASLDYWGTCLDLAQFERVVLRFLGSASKDHVVVIKEHPSMTTFRHPSFYRQVCDLPHVVLAPVAVPSTVLLDKADLVVTWTGSVGFEAAVRNLPLVTFGRAYYDTQDFFLSLESLSDLDDLAAIYDLATQKHRVASARSGPRQLVREMLKGLLPGYVFTVDYGGPRVERDRLEMQRLVESVDAYYRAIGTQSHDVHPGTLRCIHDVHRNEPVRRVAA